MWINLVVDGYQKESNYVDLFKIFRFCCLVVVYLLLWDTVRKSKKWRKYLIIIKGTQIIFDNMSLEKGCAYPRWKKAMLGQKMFRKNVTKIIREQSPSFLGPKTFFGWETEKDEIDSKFRQIFNFRLFSNQQKISSKLRSLLNEALLLNLTST